MHIHNLLSTELRTGRTRQAGVGRSLAVIFVGGSAAALVIRVSIHQVHVIVAVLVMWLFFVVGLHVRYYMRIAAMDCILYKQSVISEHLPAQHIRQAVEGFGYGGGVLEEVGILQVRF